MPNLKLTYFDFHGGRGEPARLALSIAGILFEDDRVPGADWPRRKPSTPFGSLPVLEVDGAIVTQSNGINRYVGKLADLYPSDPWQAALCDEAMEAVEDITSEVSATFSLPEDQKKAQRQALADGPITFFLTRLQQRLEAGGGQYHLGIQYAAKSGYRVVGVGRGPENAALAKKLGAFAYIDSKAMKAAEELQKLGGEKVILATAPNAKAIAELVDGLSVGGKLLIVGAPFEPMEISVLQLLMARRAIQGWPSGTAMDSQETLQFSAFAGVRPMIKKYPLVKVKEAYERMTSGHAEFRVVLTMD